MAQAKSKAVDLFGNPTLTPRQVLQQQLAEIMQDTASQTANADPRSRGASMMGSAAGGLLNKVLIEKGVLPKPPEMERAEKMAAARDAIKADAEAKGISPETNPTEFADLAASHFLRAGDEQSAMMAINWRNLQEANKRVADKERASIENIQADTELKKRSPGAGAAERSPYFSPVDTPEGVLGFDHRTNTLTRPKGAAAKMSKSDPNLQGDIAFAKNAGDEGSKNLFTNRQLAMDATNSLLGIGEARKLLDEGMKTGKFAKFEVGLGAVLHELGVSYKEDEVENAQAFVASQAKQVASIIKAFGAGTGLSDADREFAIKAAGGDIAMNEKSIRKILDINERAALNTIKNYKDLYGRVRKDYLPYSMDLPDVPQPPKAGGKAAGGVQEGATATNPKTGEKVIFKGGKWQPMK